MTMMTLEGTSVFSYRDGESTYHGFEKFKILKALAGSQNFKAMLKTTALCHGIEIPTGIDAQYDLAKRRLLDEPA